MMGIHEAAKERARKDAKHQRDIVGAGESLLVVLLIVLLLPSRL